mmetsp:Transcript_10533/g.19723  ORF Transcript_10533/g.19723 Transcript_10533/m.19723 type:complete len:219 (+) Transcript_10533:3608-4264(+)
MSTTCALICTRLSPIAISFRTVRSIHSRFRADSFVLSRSCNCWYRPVRAAVTALANRSTRGLECFEIVLWNVGLIRDATVVLHCCDSALCLKSLLNGVFVSTLVVDSLHEGSGFSLLSSSSIISISSGISSSKVSGEVMCFFGVVFVAGRFRFLPIIPPSTRDNGFLVDLYFLVDSLLLLPLFLLGVHFLNWSPPSSPSLSLKGRSKKLSCCRTRLLL